MVKTKQKKAGKTKPAEAKKRPVKGIPEVNIGLVGHVDHGKTSLTSPTGPVIWPSNAAPTRPRY